MNPISIVMFVFAAVMLLFAWAVYRGNTGLIRTFNWVKVKDKAEYAKFLGRSLARIALAPVLGGIAGILAEPLTAAVVFAVVFIYEMVIVSRRSGDYYR